MQNDEEAALLARQLLDSLGLDTIVDVSRKAEACRREGDRGGVRFWNAVVRNMRSLAACREETETTSTMTTAGASALWRLMQRVELCRHQAKLSEEKAATASPQARREMLEIARHWLELAAYAEMMAGQPDLPDE